MAESWILLKFLDISWVRPQPTIFRDHKVVIYAWLWLNWSNISDDKINSINIYGLFKWAIHPQIEWGSSYENLLYFKCHIIYYNGSASKD